MQSFKRILVILAVVFTMTGHAHAAPAPSVTAQGIAIYGWKDDVATPLWVKKEHWLFPIASLTKLVTAKAVAELYAPDQIFTISKTAAATEGITPGVVVGSQFTRDDLLKALLISSSNDAATAFMEPAGNKTFIERMNTILHTNKYTSTSFVNTSGLDPAKRLQVKSNRMTPYHVTSLLNDIYTKDDLLRDIMAHDAAEITDLKTNTPVFLRQTNALYRDPLYKDKVLMGKTGLTNLAGQNLAFVTPGNDTYDYMTIVILGSKNRLTDSKKILDWLDTTGQQFGG